jgi:hypothetical protein
MISPVKNFEFAIIAICLLLSGCRPEKTTPDTFFGSVQQPVWTAPADYDYASSMTAVVKVELTEQYPFSAANFQLQEKDMLAAFDGDFCLGVAKPVMDDEPLFFLFITGTDGDVTLRYYSAQYKRIFVAEPFPFQNDTRLGTPDNPFVPKFTLEK